MPGNPEGVITVEQQAPEWKLTDEQWRELYMELRKRGRALIDLHQAAEEYGII